jgi:hypothetical protein
MGLYDSVDAYWTWDGDYAIGNNGDLKDTEEDLLLSLEQEIATVVKSELLDWELDPIVGATLSDFVGEPNTRENGRLIEDRIRFKLVDVGIVAPEDLTVRVVPTGVHELLIMINVLTLATEGNRLTTADSVSVNISYDTMENGLFFLPATTNEDIIHY